MVHSWSFFDSGSILWSTLFMNENSFSVLLLVRERKTTKTKPEVRERRFPKILNWIQKLEMQLSCWVVAGPAARAESMTKRWGLLRRLWRGLGHSIKAHRWGESPEHFPITFQFFQPTQYRKAYRQLFRCSPYFTQSFPFWSVSILSFCIAKAWSQNWKKMEKYAKQFNDKEHEGNKRSWGK
jgi:hypothetical protein